MPNILVIDPPKLIQAKDGLTFALGDNAIVFDVPFSNTEYVFHAYAPADCVVKEKAGTRTVTGVTVTVTVAGTSQGGYDVKGVCDEYQSSGLVSLGIGATGLIQRGAQTLSAGNNTITLPEAFSDANYTLKLTFGDVHGYKVSKATGSFVVYSVDENTSFEWEATGT